MNYKDYIQLSGSNMSKAYCRDENETLVDCAGAITAAITANVLILEGVASELEQIKQRFESVDGTLRTLNESVREVAGVINLTSDDPV